MARMKRHDNTNMPCVAMSLHLHALHHLLTHSTLLGLCHCMHHVAVPFAAVHTALPCPSQLHTPHCHAPCGCTYQVAVPLMAAGCMHHITMHHIIESCIASTPAHSVSHGACFGPCSPSDGPSQAAACACPLSGPLTVVTQAYPSLFMAMAAAVSQAHFTPHSLPWAPTP